MFAGIFVTDFMVLTVGTFILLMFADFGYKHCTNSTLLFCQLKCILRVAVGGRNSTHSH